MIWAAVAIAIAVPIHVAATSPLLAWRDPVYIAAGLAGAVGMALLLVQPLLAAGFMPGLTGLTGRRVHRWTGGCLVMVVVIHVAGLWLTSPPDVVDALLFRSPTRFSPWGVVAMWALFLTAILVALRRRLRLPAWRLGHISLAVVIVVGSVIHALLIEGTMGTLSKSALSVFVLVATLKALSGLRIWPKRPAQR